MKRLETRAQRAQLLPGGPRDAFVVLFWRKSDPAASVVARRFADVVWPRCVRPVSVDLDRAPELVDWFDVSTVPMLAVVSDGAIFDIDIVCTTESCRTLIERGYPRYANLQGAGSEQM